MLLIPSSSSPALRVHRSLPSALNAPVRTRWSVRSGGVRVLREFGVRCSITGCGQGPKHEVVGCHARVASDLESARLRIAGVRRCRSARCAGCAPSVAQAVAARLRLMLDAAHGKAFGTVLLTLTVGHDAHTPLLQMRDDLGEGFNAMQQGRPYKRMKKNGLAGIARVWDLTGGRGGWHLHPHCIVFHEDGIEAALAAARELAEVWMRLMQARGYRTVAAAQDVRPIASGDRIAGYGVETLQHWGPEAELAAGIAKVGKRSDRLTLPQILNRAIAGDAWAKARFAEAATALMGQRTLVVGKYLKGRLGVSFDEADKPDGAADGGDEAGELPEEFLGTLSAGTWNEAFRACVVPQVLDIIERYAALDRMPWSQVWPMVDDYVWRGIGPSPPGQGPPLPP